MEATLTVNYLAKPFVTHWVSASNEEELTLYGFSTPDKDELSLRAEACMILSRMRSCCVATDTFIAHTLARSGIYGVCYLRFEHDLRKSGWHFWPQTEWRSVHGAAPDVAQQLALSWNADGSTRPPSLAEMLVNKQSLMRRRGTGNGSETKSDEKGDGA